MPFIQDIDAPRLILGTEALAFYKNTITYRPRPFFADKGGYNPFALLLLNMDELNVDSYDAAVEHTIKHRAVAFDKYLQILIGKGGEDLKFAAVLYDNLFDLANGYTGFDGYLKAEDAGEQLTTRGGGKIESKDTKRRIDLVRALWRSAIEVCLRECGDESAADLFESSDIKKRQKDSPLLNAARGDLETRISELPEEQKIVTAGKGLEFIFANDLGILHSQMTGGSFRASYGAKTTRIFITPKGLSSSYTMRQEIDHFCMDVVGADEYPLVRALVEKLKDGRDPKVLKALAKERSSNPGVSAEYYDRIGSFPPEALVCEILFDTIEIARREAKKNGVTVYDPKIDKYMHDNFRDYWAARKHADTEVKDLAYVRLQLANPDQDMSEAAKIRFNYDINSTDAGRSR